MVQNPDSIETSERNCCYSGGSSSTDSILSTLRKEAGGKDPEKSCARKSCRILFCPTVTSVTTFSSIPFQLQGYDIRLGIRLYPTLSESAGTARVHSKLQPPVVWLAGPAAELVKGNVH